MRVPRIATVGFDRLPSALPIRHIAVTLSKDSPMANEVTATLKRTALNSIHSARGAKMVPFAGFEMPVQYPTGITEEHRAVRERVGLFDVSHMGEFIVRGPGAVDFVNFVTTNDVAKLAIGQ